MSEIKVFPLLCTRGAIIFPLQELTVEVGRQSSIDAVNYVLENNGQIVVLSQKNQSVDEPHAEDLFDYGTLCKIKTCRKRDDHFKVVFTGIARCKVHDIIEKDNIRHVKCEVLEDFASDSDELQAAARMALSEFNSLAARTNRPAFPVVSFDNVDLVTAASLTDTFAHLYVHDLNDKYLYLQETDVTKRLIAMLSQVGKEQRRSELENLINQKVKESLDASQKDYYLREKLKAIKDELGDSASASDIDDLREKVLSNPYPENIRKKALDEMKRFEMLPPSMGESGVIRSYLDWLLSLPWWQKSEDNEDLNRAEAILEEDHYGLKKVKERILEYLAVKQMTASLKSPILCLVGPPGVGKTSLAKSVARALDRKFVKISLGGVRDEAEIRGHRRTYLGSMPGRIIQGMKKAGTLNPVFLIDEIDKMASDFKGDPSSAMLEVLDPEQNYMFSDHYIEEPYDLSDVLFIATANYLENIPPALKDRLEIIDLSSYTEFEKLNIAKEHLIRKQQNLNGLKPKQISFSDDVLLYLIRSYTREAGVRQLERIIGTCCRKAVLEILKSGKKTIKVSKKQINKWLGHERFEYGSKQKSDQIGVVTGLAFTQFGGDILPVEVSYFEGKSALVVTGQLGDVMKESCSIALDYVRANAKKYNIDPQFFENHTIHIHVPEGAVPKDGPSAGVTLTTAIVSALTNRSVSAQLAMTGEVTLRGNVLPIGGLKEKSLAANRSGIQKIIFPKSNIKDLDEVPDTVKENIAFIPVETIDQVLSEALN